MWCVVFFGIAFSLVCHTRGQTTSGSAASVELADLVSITAGSQSAVGTLVAEIVNLKFFEKTSSEESNSLKERVAALEDLEWQNQETLSSLQERMSRVEGNITAINASVTTLISELALQSQRLEDQTQLLRSDDTLLAERVNILELEAAEKIAFKAVLTKIPTLTKGSTIKFDTAPVNTGNGYNNNTGVFTVSSGGGGLYHFSVFLTFRVGVWCSVQITKNGRQLCSVWGDNQETTDDHMQTSCSAITNVTPADLIKVVYKDGDTTTPLIAYSDAINGFNGFKL